MIIAVSSDSCDADSPVSPDLGRSRFFVLHDTGRDEREAVQNPYADSLGDAGIQSAQMLIERNVGAVITGGIGRDALRIFSAADVKVCRCREVEIPVAVELFLGGKLEIIFDNRPAEMRRMRERKMRRLRGRY